MTLAIVSGLVLGLGVFAAGFSDSTTMHETYSGLVVLWQLLNAPAGIYALQVAAPDAVIYGLLQLVSSFIWANGYMLIVYYWKLRRSG